MVTFRLCIDHVHVDNAETYMDSYLLVMVLLVLISSIYTLFHLHHDLQILLHHVRIELTMSPGAMLVPTYPVPLCTASHWTSSQEAALTRRLNRGRSAS